ncbi:MULTISPECIES: hypothetical protein [Mesorhizobium]|uniref:hypothetical protein n=1 Tax=Mesorhizobium TaxID=68287 RepID=UPI0018DBA6BB|nr:MULTISPECIES: hypothetical protein [Mesorhizobium]WJI42177.1 hypothetical protein NL534_33175 [Mesorhizobium opportunistum]
MGKITALHAEAHRPEETPTPQYLSRHYYDIAMLLDTERWEGCGSRCSVGRAAKEHSEAKHKAVFFRSSWASYDTARPGTGHPSIPAASA